MSAPAPASTGTGPTAGAANGPAPAAGPTATTDVQVVTQEEYLSICSKKKRKVPGGQAGVAKRRNKNESPNSPSGITGGWLAIQGDLYLDPVIIFTHGVKFVGYELEKVPTIHRRTVDVYRRLVDFVPVVAEIAVNKDVVLTFANSVTTVRSADRSNLRTVSEPAVVAAIKKYHHFDLALVPKASRGIYHDDVCKLILPPGTADADQQRVELRTGQNPNLYPRDETHWPLFMWLLCEYNPVKILEGLFKSHLIAASLRAIFLGPMAGIRGPNKSGSGNTPRCVKYKVATVSIQNIAFGAVTVRSILDSKDYAVDSGVFSNLKFYNRILDTFASLSASRQAGILRFYQEEVFGTNLDNIKYVLREKDVAPPAPDSPQGLLDAAIAAERKEEEREEKERKEREESERVASQATASQATATQ